MEETVIYIFREVKLWGGIGEKNCNKNTQWRFQNRIYDSNGLCPALTTFAPYWIVVREDDD